METVPDDDFHCSYQVIDDVKMEDLTIDFLNTLDMLLPYGQHFEYPLFRLKQCELIKTRAFGNRYQKARTPHLQFKVIQKQVRNGRQAELKLPGVGYSLFDKFQYLLAQYQKPLFDIIFFAEFDDHSGKKKLGKKLRLNIVDIKISEDQ